MSKTFIVFVLVGMLFLSGCTLKGFENKQEALKEQQEKANKKNKLTIAVKDAALTSDIRAIDAQFERISACTNGECQEIPIPEGITINLLDHDGAAAVLGSLEYEGTFDEIKIQMADAVVRYDDGTTKTVDVPELSLTQPADTPVSGETVVQLDFNPESFVPPEGVTAYVAEPKIEQMVMRDADVSLGAPVETGGSVPTLVVHDGEVQGITSYDTKVEVSPTGEQTVSFETEVRPVENSVDVHVEDGATYVTAVVDGGVQTYKSDTENVENVLDALAQDVGKPVEDVAKDTKVVDAGLEQQALELREKAFDVAQDIHEKSLDAAQKEVDVSKEDAGKGLDNAIQKISEASNIPEAKKEEILSKLEEVKSLTEAAKAGEHEGITNAKDLLQDVVPVLNDMAKSDPSVFQLTSVVKSEIADSTASLTQAEKDAQVAVIDPAELESAQDRLLEYKAGLANIMEDLRKEVGDLPVTSATEQKTEVFENAVTGTEATFGTAAALGGTVDLSTAKAIADPQMLEVETSVAQTALDSGKTVDEVTKESISIPTNVQIGASPEVIQTLVTGSEKPPQINSLQRERAVEILDKVYAEGKIDKKDYDLARDFMSKAGETWHPYDKEFHASEAAFARIGEQAGRAFQGEDMKYEGQFVKPPSFEEAQSRGFLPLEFTKEDFEKEMATHYVGFYDYIPKDIQYMPRPDEIQNYRPPESWFGAEAEAKGIIVPNFKPVEFQNRPTEFWGTAYNAYYTGKGKLDQIDPNYVMPTYEQAAAQFGMTYVPKSDFEMTRSIYSIDTGAPGATYAPQDGLSYEKFTEQYPQFRDQMKPEDYSRIQQRADEYKTIYNAGSDGKGWSEKDGIVQYTAGTYAKIPTFEELQAHGFDFAQGASSFGGGPSGFPGGTGGTGGYGGFDKTGADAYKSYVDNYFSSVNYYYAPPGETSTFTSTENQPSALYKVDEKTGAYTYTGSLVETKDSSGQIVYNNYIPTASGGYTYVSHTGETYLGSSTGGYTYVAPDGNTYTYNPSAPTGPSGPGGTGTTGGYTGGTSGFTGGTTGGAAPPPTPPPPPSGSSYTDPVTGETHTYSYTPPPESAPPPSAPPPPSPP